jgi:hypothetical protein
VDWVWETWKSTCEPLTIEKNGNGIGSRRYVRDRFGIEEATKLVLEVRGDEIVISLLVQQVKEPTQELRSFLGIAPEW